MTLAKAHLHFGNEMSLYRFDFHQSSRHHPYHFAYVHEVRARVFVFMCMSLSIEQALHKLDTKDEWICFTTLSFISSFPPPPISINPKAYAYVLFFFFFTFISILSVPKWPKRKKWKTNDDENRNVRIFSSLHYFMFSTNKKGLIIERPICSLVNQCMSIFRFCVVTHSKPNDFQFI